MKIPKEILDHVGHEKQLFSYTVAVSDEKTPWTYFSLVGKGLFSSRFFWQSADESLAFLGLGAVSHYQGEGATFEQLQNIEAQLKDSHYHVGSTTSQGLTLCGAFPFDHDQQTETIWGELGQGYFFLPELLIRQSGKGVTLTLTVKGQTTEAVTQAWETLVAKLGTLEGALVQPVTEKPMVAVESYLEKEWSDSVTETVEMLKSDKAMEKVVLARQLKLKNPAGYRPFDIMTNLKAQQPNTYLYYLEKDGVSFIGATPERLLSATPTAFATAAVAGSTPRGKTPEADQVLGDALLNDPKNIREHGIVVTRLLKELAPLSREVDYPAVVGLLKNRDIQHLYVPMTIPRQSDMPFIKAVGMLHPTPALGGEPKEEALSWIRNIEPVGRGLYGGPIGWVDVTTDTGEFAVAIRSGVFNETAGLLYAGCGVVSDSEASLEVKETAVKFKPMLRGVTNQ